MLILKQSTAIDIRMGPFLDATDGVTPETGITLGAADQAEVLKANGAATVAMAGTFTAVTGSDGWYDYTASAGDLDTVGEVAFVVQDASECLPVFVRAQIIEEAIYDSLFGASADGFDSAGDVTVGGYASGQEPLQPTVAGRALDVTSNGNAGIDWGNIENPATTVDLSSTDINLCDTVTVNTDMRGTDSALLAASAPSNWSSMVISGAGSVDALTQGYLDTILTETTSGRIAGNFDVFFENADALTTKVVDDVGAGGGGGGTDWSAAERNEIRYRLGVDGTTAAPSTNSPNLETVDANIVQVSGDITAADNLELQYDGTGLTGDNFPATQAQVGSIATGAGGISTVAGSAVIATGTETGDYTDTQQLDGTTHDVQDDGGTTDFYYEFDVGTAGRATEVLWDGYVQSNGDSCDIYGWDWVSLSWKQVGSISGANGTTIVEQVFIFTSAMTGTGADVGTVRFRPQSTTITQFSTDRILCEYTSVAREATVFDSGVLQAAAANTATLATTASAVDDFYTRSKIVIAQGTGAGQERVLSDYDGTTKVATITPTWTTTPNTTSVYEIIPAQAHTTTRNGGYDNARVYVDVTNGSTGTLIGVNATSTNPSSSLADARTIADAIGVRIYDLKGGGLVTLDQAYTNWIFDHTNASLVDLNSQDVTGSVFLRTGVTGTGVMTTRGVFELCGIVNLTVGVCNFLQTGLSGTTTLANTDRYVAWDCFENDSSAPIIDINGDNVTATELELVNYSGRVEIRNMTATDTIVVTGQAQVTLHTSCNGGTFVWAGDVKRTDNSAVSPTFVGADINDILDSVNIVDGNVDSILEDTSSTIPDQITALNDIAATDIVSAGAITTLAGSVVNVDLVDVTTTNTDMRGTDSAALATDLATVDANVDAILVDTGTTLPGLLQEQGILKNSAFSNFEFLMVLSSDGQTPATGLTVTGQRSVDGGAFVSVSGTIAEVSNGIYQFDALAADTNGDVITWRFSSATALDRFVTIKTVQ